LSRDERETSSKSVASEECKQADLKKHIHKY